LLQRLRGRLLQSGVRVLFPGDEMVGHRFVPDEFAAVFMMLLL
jgi:hypothetical protein